MGLSNSSLATSSILGFFFFFLTRVAVIHACIPPLPLTLTLIVCVEQIWISTTDWPAAKYKILLVV